MNAQVNSYAICRVIVGVTHVLGWYMSVFHAYRVLNILSSIMSFYAYWYFKM
jgi:hypothetical protein